MKPKVLLWIVVVFFGLLIIKSVVGNIFGEVAGTGLFGGLAGIFGGPIVK